MSRRVCHRRTFSPRPAGLGGNVRAQRGVGLVEVLVALVVLSIGLLGVAVLHTTSLRFTQEAYFHTQATIHSQDLIDRMRANRRAALAGDYLRDTWADIAMACDPVTLDGALAEQDLLLWRQALACSLPGGDGLVTRDSNGIFRVTVRWQTRDKDAPLQSTITEVQL